MHYFTHQSYPLNYFTGSGSLHPGSPHPFGELPAARRFESEEAAWAFLKAYHRQEQVRIEDKRKAVLAKFRKLPGHLLQLENKGPSKTWDVWIEKKQLEKHGLVEVVNKINAGGFYWDDSTEMSQTLYFKTESVMVYNEKQILSFNGLSHGTNLQWTDLPWEAFKKEFKCLTSEPSAHSNLVHKRFHVVSNKGWLGLTNPWYGGGISFAWVSSFEESFGFNSIEEACFLRPDPDESREGLSFVTVENKFQNIEHVKTPSQRALHLDSQLEQEALSCIAPEAPAEVQKSGGLKL